ncbi:MAG: hypothetical protein CVV34_06675 [Methanomicrobiales archaeon HGW-Methanomicrobiales-5]|nr:MAG: hypothetical protein CVV34_06675 [Methanomicrobiales archaeon HGW-Methanomicrobiales-5]
MPLPSFFKVHAMVRVHLDQKISSGPYLKKLRESGSSPVLSMPIPASRVKRVLTFKESLRNVTKNNRNPKKTHHNYIIYFPQKNKHPVPIMGSLPA